MLRHTVNKWLVQKVSCSNLLRWLSRVSQTARRCETGRDREKQVGLLSGRQSTNTATTGNSNARLLCFL